jgi:hypothetical protein
MFAAGLLCAAFAAAVFADEPTEISCSVIAREPNGAPSTTKMDDLKVMEQTARDGPFSLPRGAPKAVQAVLCKRSTVIPATHDYKVLQAGFTLYLTDGLARMAAIGIVEGRVRLDMLDGALTESEQAQLPAVLRAQQAALGGSP